ncbi:MAG: glycosyltransferase [Candidatus Aenigmarchaeota archaeon]|nr:glycosyltransferase [Candidatus Aenigmarchaeota archaeon]MBU5689134.1 glycosyltransferase [Candidatus Aenigmarchaeota archaeon]
MKEVPVTIFVPVKNAENTIKACVDSLLKQTYKNKKIYIIDNMSTDKTYDILKKYGKKINLLRMAGPVPKLHNYILDIAKTEFIAYTNADCVVDKNWLKNLLKGFDSEEIVATAGYCATPKGLNKFQELIGLELESRFKKFPKYISRAPDMNLCVRTKIARKVRFDERFVWSWETDFGYRLTKLGKMKYIPEAIVYHYHRPDPKSFFKQQMKNAMMIPLIYWKNFDKIKGDHISTTNMALSLIIFYMVLISALLSLFFDFFITIYAILVFIFFFYIMFQVLLVAKKPSDYFPLTTIYIIRTFAWSVGLPKGIYMFLKNRWYKS